MRVQSRESGIRGRLRVWTLAIIGGLLALLMLAAVACDDEPRPSATPEPTTPTPEGRQEQPQQPTNPPTPELLSATPTVEVGQEEPTQPVTPPTPPATELLVPTPTPVIQEHPPPPHWGASGPSLDGAIFSADVIVLGSLSSIESGSMTIPSGEGVQPTYRPLAEMRFDVVEYLKGAAAVLLSWKHRIFGTST